MKIYCEIVTEFLPTLRAVVAKTLIDKYKITQSDAAAKLGVTQSAISQYRKNIRGNKIKLLNDKIINDSIENFAGKLAFENLDLKNIEREFYHLCGIVLKQKYMIDMKNCPICNGREF